VSTAIATEYIDKKVIIKEVKSGRQDKIFVVRGLPKGLLFDGSGKLLQGVKKSATGDGAFVFFTDERESDDRLKLIDHYILQAHPKNLPSPQRAVNAEIVGDSRSNVLSPDRLESIFSERFGYGFVDLPMENQPVRPLTEKPHSEAVAESWVKVDDIEKKEEKGPSTNLYCVECDYISEKPRALRMHVQKKHGRGMKNGSTNNTE